MSTAAQPALEPLARESQPALLPTENRAAFDASLNTLVRQHAPSDDAQIALVRNLHECAWRLARIRRTEVYLLALGMREQAPQFESETDPEMREGLTQAAAFRANARLLDQLRRHENQFLREFAALAKTLKSLQLASNFADFKAGAGASASAPIASAGTNPSQNAMPAFTGPMRDIKRKQWLRKNAK